MAAAAWVESTLQEALDHDPDPTRAIAASPRTRRASHAGLRALKLAGQLARVVDGERILKVGTADAALHGREVGRLAAFDQGVCDVTPYGPPHHRGVAP